MADKKKNDKKTTEETKKASAAAAKSAKESDAKNKESKKEAAKKEAAKKEAAKKEAAKKEAAKKEAAKKEAAKKEAAKKAKDSGKKTSITGNLKRLGGALLAKMARGGTAELRSHAEEVNRLNVFPVPDGDTGDNMAMTIESGIAAIEKLETDDIAEVMTELSQGMLLGARGNSGVILSQFFAGVASGFADSKEVDPKTLGEALELGVKQAYSTVMTPTEGTILTVAREAVEYAVSKITPQTTIKSFFNNFVSEMHASVERTPEILPALKAAGVVDSGGAGLFYIMDGFNKVLNGKKVADEVIPEDAHAKAPITVSGKFDADSVMTYGYCTELLVQLQNSKCEPEKYDVDALRAFLAELGDSIVAFKTGSIVKIHVHTLTPEKVLGHMREVGEFLTVKIENMSLQHTEQTADEQKTDTPDAPVSSFKISAPLVNAKQYGVVAVTNGEGIDALFHELGADETVRGGQTNNPSAKDFLDAFEKINAHNIFVYPNNSNILLAAQQAAGIYERSKIYVIPSKSIGTGYVALATMDFESETPEDIIDAANAAMDSVVCGYISPAIRDTQINGLDIKNGDTIGIVGKEIIVANESRAEASVELATKLLGTDHFMLTIFCGKDVDAAECVLLEDMIKKTNPSAEIYTIDAGQEVYPFIFIAE